MESQKAVEYKKSIHLQAETIKQYVNKFEIYMAKDEVALGEVCRMMDDIAQRVIGVNKAITEQAETMSQYVNKFEAYMTQDEQAFADIRDMMDKLALRVEEIDQAHKKRIHLLGELNKTYKELEDSHSRFADKIRAKTDESA